MLPFLQGFSSELEKLARKKAPSKPKPVRRVMSLTPVASSNLDSLGYDAPSKTLEVKFKSSGLYQYDQVPMATFKKVMKAKSKGKALNRLVVNGGYQYRKLAFLRDRIRE